MTEECPRILKLLDAEERTLNSSNLPLPNDTHPQITELSDLVTWSGGIVCCYPEHHGAMTGIIKTQIDWIPWAIGAVRPTQCNTLAVMQACGRAQCFNAVNQIANSGSLDAAFNNPKSISNTNSFSGIWWWWANEAFSLLWSNGWYFRRAHEVHFPDPRPNALFGGPI